MKNGTLWIVVVMLVLAGLGWFWYASTTADPMVEGEAVENQEDTTPEPVGKDGAVAVEGTVALSTVIYSDAGFSPKVLTVKKGTTVTFINQGTKDMWVGADEHPTHTSYAGTTKNDHCPDTEGVAFDQCDRGATYSFTFKKVGTWEYHNHTAASDRGTVIVTE